MAQPIRVGKHDHRSTGGLEKAGPLLADAYPDLVISKRRMRKVESIECIRLKREVARQNLGLLLSTVRPVRPAGENAGS